MLSRLALAYLRRFPIENAKWRLARLLDRKLSRGEETVRTADGFLIALDTHQFVDRVIYLTARWEEHIAKAIRQRLRPGDLFVDVGANVGYFSLLAASRGAKVMAFEPNPGCAAMLQRSVALNEFRQVDLRCMALGADRGVADLHIESENNRGGATLAPAAGGAAISVAIESLDEQLAGEAVSLVKIDVEGAEIDVLRGGERTLRDQSPPIICEVSEYNLLRFGASKDALFEFMAACGYGYEIISQIRTSTLCGLSPHFHFDVIFSKRERVG